MRVVDASVTLAWLYPAETTDAVNAVFADMPTSRLAVPRLWHLEVANVLLVNLRRGKYDVDTFDDYLIGLAELPIDVDESTESYAWTVTMRLARRHQLTLYDASYLELAMRLGAPLATLDRDLRRAAEAEVFPLLGM